MDQCKLKCYKPLQKLFTVKVVIPVNCWIFLRIYFIRCSLKVSGDAFFEHFNKKCFFNSFPHVNFAFVLSDDFLNQFFRKILSRIHVPSECKTDWVHIRPDKMSGLIWVPTVCKCYQQTTLVGNELRNVLTKYAAVFFFFRNLATSGFLDMCKHGDNFVRYISMVYSKTFTI